MPGIVMCRAFNSLTLIRAAYN